MDKHAKTKQSTILIIIGVALLFLFFWQQPATENEANSVIGPTPSFTAPLILDTFSGYSLNEPSTISSSLFSFTGIPSTSTGRNSIHCTAKSASAKLHHTPGQNIAYGDKCVIGQYIVYFFDSATFFSGINTQKNVGDRIFDELWKKTSNCLEKDSSGLYGCPNFKNY